MNGLPKDPDHLLETVVNDFVPFAKECLIAKLRGGGGLLPPSALATERLQRRTWVKAVMASSTMLDYWTLAIGTRRGRRVLDFGYRDLIPEGVLLDSIFVITWVFPVAPSVMPNPGGISAIGEEGP